MVELLMAMTILVIALTALLVVFTSSMFAQRRAGQRTTAAALADAQMETYRAMTWRDIGIDTTATVDSNYKNDAACANGANACATNGVAATEQGPSGPNSCSTVNGWYPNTDPCMPSRTVSRSTTPASPDGRSYRVDTYVVLSGTRTKQVTVVVRDSGALGGSLARETSIFDCSTGQLSTWSTCNG